jgi:hypothetical protein
VLEKLASFSILKYNLEEIVKNIHVGDAYDTLKPFVGVPKSENYHSIRGLADTFSPNYRMQLQQAIEEHTEKFRALNARYPLIDKLDYRADCEDVVHYINLIDKV